MKKIQVAVIGSASNSLCVSQQKLAFDVGRAVIESGGRLLSGGMGGVMKHSAKGAHAAENYQSGDVVGVLPSYQAEEANKYVDITLPTGLGVARNAVLMAASDAVIALDGGSGTLSEIAMAWQMKKPISCIGDEGWQYRLASLALDSRRDDCIQILQDVTGIPAFIEDIGKHQKTSYQGIVKSKMSFSDISDYLLQQFPKLAENSPLKLLGLGAEGGVVTDGSDVYKLFYPNEYGMLLFSNLNTVAECLADSGLVHSPLPAFNVFKGELIVVSYPYFDSVTYEGGKLELFIPFLKKLKAVGLCLSNLKSENFRISNEGELVYIDIGRDVLTYSDSMFRSSCKRAFITARYAGDPEIKEFYRYSNDYGDFNIIANSKSVPELGVQLMAEFTDFYTEVVS